MQEEHVQWWITPPHPWHPHKSRVKSIESPRGKTAPWSCPAQRNSIQARRKRRRGGRLSGARRGSPEELPQSWGKHSPSSGPLVFIKQNSGKVTFMLEQSRFLFLMSKGKRKIVLIKISVDTPYVPPGVTGGATNACWFKLKRFTSESLCRKVTLSHVPLCNCANSGQSVPL